jgi:hypothetical protein
MALPSVPVITGPYAVSNFSTNKIEQRISGMGSANTLSLYIHQRPDLTVMWNTTTLRWYVDVNLEEGQNIFYIIARNAEGISEPANIEILLTSDDELSIISTPPSGLVVSITTNAVLVSWQGSSDPDVIGYNVRRSDSPAGGLKGYILQNTGLVTEINRSEEVKTPVSQESVVTGNTEEVTTVYSVENVSYYEYEDSMVLEGGGIDRTVYYYVVTSVKFDALRRQEVESPNSAEVVGQATLMSQTIATFPLPVQRDIVVRMVNSLFQAQPKLDVKTGQVARDILDVMAEDEEDVWKLLDFMNRSQSFVTLTAIDDADGDGISDTVAGSTYKTSLKKALNLDTDSDVQLVIDSAFTRLAATFGVERITSKPSRVILTFYVKSAPDQNLEVNVGDRVLSVADTESGVPELTFKVLEAKTMQLENLSSYYNLQNQRWELRVKAECETAGQIGNVSLGTITTVLSGAVGLGVSNDTAAFGGEDSETNLELQERTLLRLAGVDTGREKGYLAKTLEVGGVQDARVVSAGNDIMLRDWDDIRKKHIGGKVDVYIRGESVSQMVETVPFGNMVNQVAKVRIYSVPMLQFIVENEAFSDGENAIYAVSSVRNITRDGKEYDLTGLTIIPPNAIDLDETRPLNQRIGLSSFDVVEVTYDRRNKRVFTLLKQPLEEVIQVVGELSGSLQDNVNIFKQNDPLLIGRSSLSQDGVEIFFNPANGKPTGSRHEVTDESVVLVNEQQEALGKVGVDRRTVVVKNVTGDVTYVAGIDYELEVDGYETNIYRLTEGSIPNGATVLVSYEADENVQLTYSYQSTVERVAEQLDNFKHLTADVAVKLAVEVPIDITMTVGLRGGANRLTVDGLVRSQLKNQIDSRRVGESVYQSDVIGWMETVEGVGYVVVPLTRMVRADQAMINAEELDIAEDPESPNGWERVSAGVSSVWRTKRSVLNFATVDGGGAIYVEPGRVGRLYRHAVVYVDKQALSMVETEIELKDEIGLCFIRKDGKIVVSLPLGNTPYKSSFMASYWVEGEQGSKDIVVRNLEYPVLNDLVINYRE